MNITKDLMILNEVHNLLKQLVASTQQIADSLEKIANSQSYKPHQYYNPYQKSEAQDEAQDEVTEPINFKEMADKLKEMGVLSRNEAEDLEIKGLIGAFIGSCQQYFMDVHIHRNILPNDYEKVDHLVQDLLESYEANLAYLRRNPDVKFKILTDGEIHKDHTSPNGTQHSIRRKILAVFSLDSNDFDRKLLNEFLDCITDSWEDFKIANKKVS